MDNARKNFIRAAKEFTRSLKPEEALNVLQAVATYIDNGDVMEMSAKEFALFAVFMYAYDEFMAGGE